MSPAPSCEHVFAMGAAGSPYAAFRRALDGRSATRALVAAADLPTVSLADALELCLLLLDQEPARFSCAAGRWASRYGIEHRSDLAELGLVVAALESLKSKDSRPGAISLLGLCQGSSRVPTVERASERRVG